MSTLLSPALVPLDALAAEIHEVWGAARSHQVEAWEGYLRTGRLLAEVRRLLPGDREFGRWCDAQGFGFSSEWGRRLVWLAEREAVEATCVLVNNTTETGWWQRLAASAAAVCFPAGRIKFGHLGMASSPLQGQAIVYLGADVAAFRAAFEPLGIVLVAA